MVLFILVPSRRRMKWILNQNRSSEILGKISQKARQKLEKELRTIETKFGRFTQTYAQHEEMAERRSIIFARKLRSRIAMKLALDELGIQDPALLRRLKKFMDAMEETFKLPQGKKQRENLINQLQNHFKGKKVDLKTIIKKFFQYREALH